MTADIIYVSAVIILFIVGAVTGYRASDWADRHGTLRGFWLPFALYMLLVTTVMYVVIFIIPDHL